MSQESKLSGSLAAALTGHYVRIENTIGRGTLDVHYSIAGHSWWLELKIDEGQGTKLRPEQVVFMERQYREGCRCLVISKNLISNMYHLWQYPFAKDFTKDKKYVIVSNPKKTFSKPSQLNEILLELITNEQST